IWNEYVPDKILVLAENTEKSAEFVPLLQGREMIGENPTAFVCENFTCQKPVTTVEELKQQLA
ncbi:MAG: hypothetical protein ACR2HT_03210, partial [Pyrinomonadaceae bacterium]